MFYLSHGDAQISLRAHVSAAPRKMEHVTTLVELHFKFQCALPLQTTEPTGQITRSVSAVCLRVVNKTRRMSEEKPKVSTCVFSEERRVYLLALMMPVAS